MIGVTGVTGHIGFALAKALNKNGIAFKALVRDINDPVLNEISADFHIGNVLAPESLKSFCRDVNILIHLAGFISIHKKDTDLYERINVEGVDNIIQACKHSGVSTLIHFSSIHAHRSLGLDVEINEKTPYAGDSIHLYDSSKAKGEILVLKARDQGLNTVILNPTGVIGPYDIKPSLIGQMIIHMYNGKMPVLIKGGFDWIDVRDVVKATLKIVESDIRNEKFILSGSYHSLQDIASLIYSYKGRRYRGISVPIGLAKAGLPLATAYSAISGKKLLFSEASLDAIAEASNKVNGNKANQILDLYRTPFEKTIFDTLHWFNARKKIK